MLKNKSRIFKLRDGRKLGYIEYGDRKGKPLFYYHGWPGSRFSGLETDKAGKKIGVRIISTDRPGIGVSDYKGNRTLLDWPNDVLELADKLRIKKFAIMGCSGGGPYVAACAYKIPERITKAAIIVGVTPTNTKGVLEGISFLEKIIWKCYQKFPFIRTLSAAIAFKYFPFISLQYSFAAKEDRIAFRKRPSNITRKIMGEAFRQGLKGLELDLKVFNDDWRFNLKDIRVKVYLWYGAKDKNVPLKMGKYYKSQIPNSKLFIDQNGGHLFRYNIEDKLLSTLTK